MTRIRTLRGKVEPIVGVLVLGLAIVLLVLSNRTGKEQNDLANRELDRVETVNARLDAAVLALRFRSHTDFDLVTELARELRLASSEVARIAGGVSGTSIESLVAQKIEMLEEFKSQQAVVRNSVAISEEMMAELWVGESQAVQPEPLSDALLKVERALLHYIAEGNYSTAERRAPRGCEAGS